MAMTPGLTTNLHELRAAGETFLCVRPPDADLSAGARLAESLTTRAGKPPALLYWDARVEGADPDAWLRFGHGGLDPIIASEQDLSRCIAVNTSAFERLKSRGAVSGEADFARAAALLSRSPGVDSLWCEGFVGAVKLTDPGPMAFPRGPATHAENISLAILAVSPDASLEPFFAALKGQAIQAQLDVLVLTVGFGSPALKQVARQIDAAAAADPRLNKVRRYAFSSELGPAYLANMAVGLAGADAVILADSRCVPVSPGALQHLADWSISGDASSACPRVVFDRRLLSAGLAVARRGDEDGMTPWTDAVLSDAVRTAAAPAPWMFAVRRSAWLAANGLRGVSGPSLWTAELGAGHGARGRCVLVGSEIAEWVGPEGPVSADAFAAISGRLQAPVQSALRDPRQMEVLVTASTSFGREAAPVETPAYGFSDIFPTTAERRLLVFADAFGPSQSIAFVEGLAAARAAGRVAVRIVEEAAFEGDGRSLDQPDAAEIVDLHVRETRPTVIVVSRLGHSAVWAAARDAARRLDVGLVAHIDDDLIDLPAVLGAERYRLARHPQRVRTLRLGLTQADLVVTATPALAERLQPEAGHDRFAPLSVGAAARPPESRPTSTARGDLAIGYMGSASHDHDLAMVVPALNRISAAYPFVRIVLFGSIAEQPAAQRLQGRIERYAPVWRNYTGFRRRLGELGLGIGLAPLADNPFNRAKTPTKWVEYAEAGAAVLASPIRPYLPIIAERAAMAATPDQWEAGLRRLVEDPALRRDLVARGDALLTQRFGWDRLEDEVLAALARLDRPGRQVA
jgi:glycosyltransferase involved in cell wall biosynthesis